ncbi:MAG: nuclear transport factor 2 family protein [Chitinophagaceae bacterium]
MNIIEKFYQAFQQKDYATMQQCYHDEAVFTDEIFLKLNAAQVRAMWQMLIISGKDMQLVYKDVTVTGDTGSANWIATYTFSLTKRKVVNDIQAVMQLKDGLIYCHRDHFNFYTWSSMAFGAKGALLGWLPFFRKKIQAVSKGKLDAFMSK